MDRENEIRVGCFLIEVLLFAIDPISFLGARFFIKLDEYVELEERRRRDVRVSLRVKSDE